MPNTPRPYRDELEGTEWEYLELVAAKTRCKHGWGSCSLCGTNNQTDVIHRARTPDKRAMRRLRKKQK